MDSLISPSVENEWPLSSLGHKSRKTVPKVHQLQVPKCEDVLISVLCYCELDVFGGLDISVGQNKTCEDFILGSEKL